MQRPTATRNVRKATKDRVPVHALSCSRILDKLFHIKEITQRGWKSDMRGKVCLHGCPRWVFIYWRLTTRRPSRGCISRGLRRCRASTLCSYGPFQNIWTQHSLCRTIIGGLWVDSHHDLRSQKEVELAHDGVVDMIDEWESCCVVWTRHMVHGMMARTTYDTVRYQHFSHHAHWKALSPVYLLNTVST